MAKDMAASYFFNGSFLNRITSRVSISSREPPSRISPFPRSRVFSLESPFHNNDNANSRMQIIMSLKKVPPHASRHQLSTVLCRDRMHNMDKSRSQIRSMEPSRQRQLACLQPRFSCRDTPMKLAHLRNTSATHARRSASTSLLFVFQSKGFSTVVNEAVSEPRMLESLLGSDAFALIVDEDFL